MLTIEETKKALDAGEIVYLEHNVRGKALNELYFLELEKLEVGYVNINENGLRDGVYIKDGSGHVRNSSYFIPKEELKYFRIKRPAPTFHDLIDVATQALKDGLLSKLDIIEGNSIGGTVKEGLSNVLHFHTGIATDIQSRIDFIKSLYTETFTIEHESDIVKIKLGDLITLENGNEVWAESNCLNHNVNFIQATYGGNNFNLSYLSLKGATVTKKRGAA